MKRTVFFVLALLCSWLLATMHAQEQYKILFLNTSPIEIGGKQCQVNDCFDISDKIHWKNDGQVMKVMNLRTQRQSVVAARGFKKKKHKTLSSYLSQNKQLSTRDGSPLLLPQLKDYLADTFYLIDSIEVKALAPMDDRHFFYADYRYKDEIIHKRLPATENGFLIDYSLFTIDGKPITPFETDLSIYYLDNEQEKAMLITTHMHVVPVK